MKLLIVAVIISISCTYATEQYPDRYDKVNLDEVLANKRLLYGYMKCALEIGPCTPEGKELKYYIVDALKSDCEKCSDHHRKSIKKVIKHLMKHEAGFWKQAVDKYDPERKYTEIHERELHDI